MTEREGSAEGVGDRSGVVGAAVDAGSNSVHLVVGSIDPEGGGVAPLVDESELLGLGDVVDAGGVITVEAQERLIVALHRYIAVARAYGAQHVTLLGTEPFRRATNAAEVVAAVKAGTGQRLLVLRHEDEGLLTLLGVTGGIPVTRPLLVVDIGGGSSDFVLTLPGAEPIAGGVATGASRLTRQLVRGDPPTGAEVVALRAAATEFVAATPSGRAERAVMVGGTATNLVKLASDGRHLAERLGPAASRAADADGGLRRSVVSDWGEGRLDREALAEAVALIQAETADEISERYLVNRRRAGMLAAGAALVEAFMDHFEVSFAEVSRVSLREGAILARARAGESWLEALPSLAVRGS